MGEDLRRRDVLRATVAAGGAALLGAASIGCQSKSGAGMAPDGTRRVEPASTSLVKSVKRLGFPWRTRDPFLFCAYHNDAYPEGNGALGPDASLSGRNIGSDFGRKDGWSMYHGRNVPGFPRHPHRGFETVSIVRKGYVDHADSLGATARYGQGDVQWMTAGAGIVHAEMFPLLDTDDDNPLEMFQVWLNLPARNKMVDPHFKMIWGKQIPRHALVDPSGKKSIVTVIAGELDDVTAPAPAPKSWAADKTHDVAIWTIAMDPGATLTLPPAKAGTERTLYHFRGKGLTVAGRALDEHAMVEVVGDQPLPMKAGDAEVEILMLQGKPIGEPVAKRGPFVMNTQAEIRQAYEDYNRTGFGGWPWGSSDPVHRIDAGRFAKHADGHIETAG